MREINEGHELELLMQSKKALLLYFYNDNCAPCVALRPKVSEMIEQSFTKMELVFINAQTNPQIAASQGVFASPTVIVYFDGKENFRVSKYISISELTERIRRYYNILFS